MAYNADNEERKELCAIKKNNRGDFIVISEIKNKTNGNVSIDIRQYYTNDDEQVMPTSKGTRFNSENLTDVMVALADALDVVELDDVIEKLQALSDSKDTSDD